MTVNVIQYQSTLIKGGQVYGTSKVFKEIGPHLQNIMVINIEKKGMISYCWDVARNYWDRGTAALPYHSGYWGQQASDREKINHFCDPLMGFMGHINPEMSIITINDTIPRNYYGFHSMVKEKIVWDKCVEGGYRKFDALMTISDYSKECICRDYRVQSNRVHVIPLGVNTEQFHKKPTPYRKIIRIPEDSLVIGTVGNYRDHKNLGILLEILDWLDFNGIKAYALHAGYFNQYDAYERAGKRAISQKLEHCNSRNRYVDLGYVKDLAAFYNALDVYLAPSHMEGFDLPMLEAMACDVPVMASDIPAHMEVGGDAADYRHMGVRASIDEIAGDIIAISHHRAEKAYERYKRVQELTWQKSGEALMTMYREMAS